MSAPTECIGLLCTVDTIFVSPAPHLYYSLKCPDGKITPDLRGFSVHWLSMLNSDVVHKLENWPALSLLSTVSKPPVQRGLNFDNSNIKVPTSSFSQANESGLIFKSLSLKERGNTATHSVISQRHHSVLWRKTSKQRKRMRVELLNTSLHEALSPSLLFYRFIKQKPVNFSNLCVIFGLSHLHTTYRYRS